MEAGVDSGCQFQRLTPAGTGAITVLELTGGSAWATVRALCRRPNDKPLPPHPAKPGHWFANLGHGAGDEVVVVLTDVPPQDRVEIHGHGGEQVARYLMAELQRHGAVPAESATSEYGPFDANSREYLLAHAPTQRVANILLDQYSGAFDRACRDILEREQWPLLEELHVHLRLAEHLIEPWRIVIAGAPNAGKSTLINALLGFERCITAPTAGTTRDLIRSRGAIDGWPVELVDTAGLRTGESEIEQAGIDLARSEMRSADLVLWLADSTDPHAALPPPEVRGILLATKCDEPPAWHSAEAVRISAKTGERIGDLLAMISRELIPAPPQRGRPVPATPDQMRGVRAAMRAYRSGDLAAARRELAASVRLVE